MLRALGEKKRIVKIKEYGSRRHVIEARDSIFHGDNEDK